MVRQANKFTYAIAAFLIALLIIPLMAGGGAQFASAAASSYSDVIEDLHRDKKFTVDDYPANNNDYSLQVIQIAESADGELFIYVYQPCGLRYGLKASSINIARQLNNSEDLHFDNYTLTLLNSTGVFYKYKVNAFEIKKTAVRYYNISNILRPFNSNIDKPLADGQTETEVPNAVGQLWTAETVNDNVTYTLLSSEVIEITQKVVGYCLYDDGMNLGWGAMQGATKAYFVAFDTDRPINKLISADISFRAQKVKFYVCGNQSEHTHDYLYDMHDLETVCYGIDTDYGANTVHKPPLTIKHTEKFSNEGGGNWAGRPANTYTWNRIRKTTDFISDNSNKDYTLTDSSEQQLSDTKWVLNFYEAHDRYFYDNVWLSFIPGVTKIPGAADGEAQFEFAYDVMILRLEFETNGERYNLGVVDNRQTGNEQFNEYIGGGSGCAASWEWLKILPWWAWLLIVIAAIVVIVILVKLVTLPFRRRGGSSAKRNRRHKTGKKRKGGKGGKK